MNYLKNRLSLVLILAALVGCRDQNRVEPSVAETKTTEAHIQRLPNAERPQNLELSPAPFTDTSLNHLERKEAYLKKAVNQYIVDHQARGDVISAHDYSAELAFFRELAELQWMGSNASLGVDPRRTGEWQTRISQLEAYDVNIEIDLRRRGERLVRIRDLKRTTLDSFVKVNPDYARSASDIITNKNGEFNFKQMTLARQYVRAIAEKTGYPLTLAEENEFIIVNLETHHIADRYYKVLPRLERKGIKISPETRRVLFEMQRTTLDKFTEISDRIEKKSP